MRFTEPASVPLAIPRASVMLALLLTACASGPRAEAPRATLIRNAVVIDGSGSVRRSASVRVVGDRIAEVGDLTPRATDDVMDAHGLVLAPGFIDTHSHHDRGIFEYRDALAAVSQGVTTIIVGQDGGSHLPLADFFAHLEREPPAINVGSYVGHGTVRDRVMGEDFRRVATLTEVDRMRDIVRTEMAAGALGLSSGLEYDPGIYSAPTEVIALAKVSADAGGRYISHIRSEDREFWKAIAEIVEIGRVTGAPVQISHTKLAMRSSWGLGDSLVRVLDRARASGVKLTADVYPYTYWQSTLTVLFPERNFKDRAAADFALREVSAPDGLLLGEFEPDTTYVGKTVADISTLRGTDPATTLMALIDESLALERKVGHGTESVIGTSMDERDIERILAWPYSNICSDGELAGRHPRGYGAFTRVLARYVRERKVLTLEDAVRKMTSLAAANVGIPDRGLIAAGRRADLVLFDPQTVRDLSTPTDPQHPSVGIQTVWVNGEVVYEGGRTTGRHPGRVVRRTGR